MVLKRKDTPGDCNCSQVRASYYSRILLEAHKHFQKNFFFEEEKSKFKRLKGGHVHKRMSKMARTGITKKQARNFHKVGGKHSSILACHARFSSYLSDPRSLNILVLSEISCVI